MPPRKRTNNKATPPSSPTMSTSHSHADHSQHTPLRRRSTGPVIGTRARASSKPPATASHLQDEVIAEEENKPPPVPRIGRSTKFARFVYTLTLIAVMFFLWYAYGMVTLLARIKDEVGWWGIIAGGGRGRRGMRAWEGWGVGSGEGGRREGGDLEGSLNALADALGVDPVDVASAVRPLASRASLTSVASKTGRTGESKAVRALFEDGARILEGFAEEEILD